MDTNEDITQEVENTLSPLHKATPLSKYLVMIVFVLLPFIGGWIGYTYAPEKVVEVERIILKEVEMVEDLNSQDKIEDSSGSIAITSESPLFPGEPDIDTPEFSEYLYREGARPFLFGEPSRSSVIREHSQCEPFDNQLFEYNKETRDYEMVTELIVDKDVSPCNLYYIGSADSKHYFAEHWGMQEMYIVDTEDDSPMFNQLPYTFLHAVAASGTITTPMDKVLVTDFEESTLLLFDLNTQDKKVITTNEDHGFLGLGKTSFVVVKRFTDAEIEFAVVRALEPGEQTDYWDGYPVTYITVSLE
jgi:hypothetical protein